jgi:hypothetical protein
MNPLQRIEALEERVMLLELALVKKAETKPTAKKAKNPDRFTRPLCDKAKQLVLLAFDEVKMMKEGSTDPLVRMIELQEHIRSLDTDKIMPALNGLGDTVRAIIAERAGFFTQWAAKPVKEGHGHE